MPEANGHQDSLSRLDRIEIAIAHVISEHEKVIGDHKFLLRAQVVMTERIDKLAFTVQDWPAGTGLKRIVADFHFERPRKVRVLTDEVEFQAGERLRLFFSYRHTPDQVRALLAQSGLAAVDQWISRSEEEGVFLCVQREQTR